MSGLINLMYSRFNPNTPLTVATLTHWWDAADLATLWKDTARTSAVTADADLVQGVTDKSGAGHHLVEGTNPPAYKAAIRNGRSVLRFDATNDLITGSASATAAATVFVVAIERSAATATNRTVWSAAASSQLFTGTGLVASGKYGYFSNEAAASVDTGFTPAAWSVVSLKFVSAASATFYYNGASPQTFDPANGFSTSTTRALGAAVGGGNPGDYDIGEVLEYNTALGDTDRNTIEAYLRAKWGTP